MHRIAIIRGDGVGPEVSDAAVRVIEATGVNCTWEQVFVGQEAERRYSVPLPRESIELIRECGVVLKSPLFIGRLRNLAATMI